MIVNLAIEDNPYSPIFVVDWLLAALEINDRQPPHRQPCRTVQKAALSIGPAMPYGLAHPCEYIAVNQSAVSANDTCDSTHFRSVAAAGSQNLRQDCRDFLR